MTGTVSSALKGVKCVLMLIKYAHTVNKHLTGILSTVKSTRCTIFSSLLNIAVRVLDGLSVHHQEFKTVHTASGICHTG